MQLGIFFGGGGGMELNGELQLLVCGDDTLQYANKNTINNTEHLLS